MQVNAKELRQHLSEYLDRASRGQTLDISMRGKPVARLTQIEARSKPEQDDLFGIYQIEKPVISIITQMELVQDLRNKQEQVMLHRFLEHLGFEVLPVTDVISHRALFLMEEWCLSHQMLMADAMIAATAIEHGLFLLSGNEKHYRFLKMLTLEGFKP